MRLSLGAPDPAVKEHPREKQIGQSQQEGQSKKTFRQHWVNLMEAALWFL